MLTVDAESREELTRKMVGLAQHALQDATITVSLQSRNSPGFGNVSSPWVAKIPLNKDDGNENEHLELRGKEPSPEYVKHAHLVALCIGSRLQSFKETDGLLSAKRILREAAYGVFTANSLEELAGNLPQGMTLCRRREDGSLEALAVQVGVGVEYEIEGSQCIQANHDSTVLELGDSVCLKCEGNCDGSWAELLTPAVERLLLRESIRRNRRAAHVTNLVATFATSLTTATPDESKRSTVVATLHEIFDAEIHECLGSAPTAPIQMPLDSLAKLTQEQLEQCLTISHDSHISRSFVRSAPSDNVINVLIISRKLPLTSEEKQLFKSLCWLLLQEELSRYARLCESSRRDQIEQRLNIEVEQHGLTQSKLLALVDTAKQQELLLMLWKELMADGREVSWDEAVATAQECLMKLFHSRSASIHWDSPPAEPCPSSSTVEVALLKGDEDPRPATAYLLKPCKELPETVVELIGRSVGNALSASSRRLSSRNKLVEFKANARLAQEDLQQQITSLQRTLRIKNLKHELLRSVMVGLEDGPACAVEEILKDALPIRRMAIVRHDPSQHVLVKGEKRADVQVGNGVLVEAVLTGKEVYVNSAEEARLTDFDRLHPRMKNCLCLPLSTTACSSSRLTWGVLQVELNHGSDYSTCMVEDLREITDDLEKVLTTLDWAKVLRESGYKLQEQVNDVQRKHAALEAALEQSDRAHLDYKENVDKVMSLMECVTLGDFLKTLSTSVCESVCANRASLFLWNHRGTLKKLEGVGKEMAVKSSGIIGHCATENRVVMLNDKPQGHEKFCVEVDGGGEGHRELKNLLCVPFYIRPNLTGA